MRWQRAVATIFALSLVMVACTNNDSASTGDGSGQEKVTLDFWVFEEGGIGSFLKTLESDLHDRIGDRS